MATIVFSGLGLGIGWLAVMVAFRDIYAWLVVVVGAALLIGAAVAIARRQHRDSLRRGWAIGKLIGLGLALLINGLCFVSLMGIGG